jgi:hypothetical protein
VTPERIIAIDWSGAKRASTQRKTIWVADWRAGRVSLESGRTREDVVNWLLEQAETSKEIIVGLDFAFSFPAWFLREKGFASAPEMWWILSEGSGEDWLQSCYQPFWGRPKRRCPSGHREPDWRGFRKTDRSMNIEGIRPKSPFQIGGAGAVGTGSIRGMIVLENLRKAFCIWPFEPIDNLARGHVAIEIYPRHFTGPVKKSSATARREYLSRPEFADLPENILQKARGSEDGFDALVSVLGMAKHAGTFAALKQETDPDALLEGTIWRP